MESTRLVEEPISAELVLVDRELARRARAALPDPPWLLPVLAEQQRTEVARTGFSEERSARAMQKEARRPFHRSLARHIASTLAGGCVLLVFTVLVASAADLFAGPDEPTFSTTPPRHAATPQAKQSSVGAHARASRKARRSEPRTNRPARSSEGQRLKTTSSARRARTRRRKSAPASKPAAMQRVFSWRRRAAAVYYQFYLQRGAKTIFQARTVKLSVALPARLKLKPGTYHVLVRPAIPSDAGVILGAPIVAKTMRV